jgi:hypothetical protein
MRATTKPITIPATLQIGWALLLSGFVALSAGYFTQTPWQSLSGLLCFIFGYVIVILDMVYRKRPTSEEAIFYGGAITTQVVSVFALAFVALLGAIFLAIYSAVYGFSSSHAIRLFHFLGIVYAYSVVMSIPNAVRALKAEPKNQTEPSVSANGG